MTIASGREPPVSDHERDARHARIPHRYRNVSNGGNAHQVDTMVGVGYAFVPIQADNELA
jgi:hypothetical protein